MVNSEDKKEYFFIFDIDETLTKPKSKITKEMVGLIKNLTKLGKIFLVGGAKFENINEQTLDISEYVEYIFCENGTAVYKNGNLIKKQELLGKINESELQKVINFILKTLSKIILPFKRGTFIEFRTGLINVSPLGRNCTLDERKMFEEFDKEKNVLSSLKHDIDNFLSTNNINLISTFGGKISLDIFPKDSTKSCCLNFLETEYNFNNKKLIFFGDKIYEGGNDYPIAIDNRVAGYFWVKNELNTEEILKSILTDLNIENHLSFVKNN